MTMSYSLNLMLFAHNLSSLTAYLSKQKSMKKLVFSGLLILSTTLPLQHSHKLLLLKSKFPRKSIVAAFRLLIMQAVLALNHSTKQKTS